MNLEEGFFTFEAFKKVHGEAGKGNAWHRIVEQTINKGNFSAKAIHNPANLVVLPHGKGTIHNKISAHYSSKQSFNKGQTVRKWLSTQSYQDQFDYGIKTIKDSGGAQYLPKHLR